MALQQISNQLIQLSSGAQAHDVVSSGHQFIQPMETNEIEVEVFNLERLQVEVHRLSQSDERVPDDEKALLSDLLRVVRKWEIAKQRSEGQSVHDEGAATSSSTPLVTSSEEVSSEWEIHG